MLSGNKCINLCILINIIIVKCSIISFEIKSYEYIYLYLMIIQKWRDRFRKKFKEGLKFSLSNILKTFLIITY